MSSDRIAHIVSRFPKLSETFILDEIIELRRSGLAIDLYSLIRGSEAVSHPQAQELTDELHAADGERCVLDR